jgi:hypothetical protein
MSFVSTPVGGGSAPAGGGGGATSDEGGEALLSERVAHETENLQRGQPPQGRREGHQPRVADSGVRLNSNTAPSL